MRMILGGATALLLVACNPIAQMNDADEQIDLFHERYSAGNYEAIYQDATPEFREVAEPEEWATMMRVVSGRLGAVTESSQSGFNVNTNNGVTTTTITRDTIYENGEGAESFTYVGSGDEMALLSWEVVSDELIGASITEGKVHSDEAGVPADESEKPLN